MKQNLDIFGLDKDKWSYEGDRFFYIIVPFIIGVFNFMFQGMFNLLFYLKFSDPIFTNTNIFFLIAYPAIIIPVSIYHIREQRNKK